jgi:hypothetical protein
MWTTLIGWASKNLSLQCFQDMTADDAGIISLFFASFETF